MCLDSMPRPVCLLGLLSPPLPCLDNVALRLTSHNYPEEVLRIHFHPNHIIALTTMAYELHIIIAFTILSLLDAYQSKAQEVVLDKMGENKASYGLKSMDNIGE